MPKTVHEAFAELPTTYNAEMGIGLNCTFQWDVTGDGGGHWYAELNAGALSVHEGQTERPGLRITVAAGDWLDIVNGRLAYDAAYACGKVRMVGELPLHKKVKMLFLETHHKPAK